MTSTKSNLIQNWLDAYTAARQLIGCRSNSPAFRRLTTRERNAERAMRDAGVTQADIQEFERFARA